MIKTIYIQVDPVDRLPVAPCGFTLWEGARFLGLNPTAFIPGELPLLPRGPDTLVHGWVKTVKDALVLRGKTLPEPVDYPDALTAREFLGRRVWRSTLGEVHEQFTRSEGSIGGPAPVFVKPVEHKLFTGHTVERFSHLAETSNLPRDTAVWVSDVIEFVSEYRCFVHDRGLVDMRRYYGDAWVLPSRAQVIRMIKAFDPSPAFYSLDVGVTREGFTYLVEVNDGFALGDYGMRSLAYTEGVISRWEEMVRVD